MSVIMAGFGTSQKKKSEINLAPPADTPCACGSKIAYGSCCMPFHTGEALPATPSAVVRSRFSALTYSLPDFIINTTSPKHKEYVPEEKVAKRKVWVKGLRAFSGEYDFVELIFDEGEEAKDVGNDRHEIAFKARLRQKGAARTEDVTEKSIFERDSVTGAWMYLDAEIDNPFKNVAAESVTPKSQRMVTTAKRGVGKGN